MPSIKACGFVYTEAELEEVLKKAGDERDHEKFILPDGSLDHEAIWAKYNKVKAGPPKRRGR